MPEPARVHVSCLGHHYSYERLVQVPKATAPGWLALVIFFTGVLITRLLLQRGKKAQR
jgi:hypothetical protein